MIDSTHRLPIVQQARVLDVARSTVYYLPRPVSDLDLELMRQIDQLHLQFPFMGARSLRLQLPSLGLEVGRRHIGTLMAKIVSNTDLVSLFWDVRFEFFVHLMPRFRC